MIRMCHYVTYFTLLALSLLSLIAHANPAESDLQRIEHQIQSTRVQLTELAAELRDAKVLAAEKMIEYEATRDAFQNEQNSVNANSLDHAQQRLALAEMGVESKAARFERIKKRLETLAEAKQEILAEPPSLAGIPENTISPPAKQPPQNTAPTPPSPPNPIAETNTEQPPETSSQTAAKVIAQSSDEAIATREITPVPLIRKILQKGDATGPVLTQQGKISDVYQLNAELRKLESHLVSYSATSAEPIQAKVYGTAITGEISLVQMGGNQFFARFPAPEGPASLIIGARIKSEYVRTELQMTFTPEEAGKEFVLIFDINTKDQPRALVFQESLAFTQEMFASHNDF